MTVSLTKICKDKKPLNIIDDVIAQTTEDEAQEVYYSDKAKIYRDHLDMLARCLSEHQYWCQVFDKKYKEVQKEYVKFLGLEEK